MAISDFGAARLAIDALAIAGPLGTGGEAFTYAGTTYYGIFNEVDRSVIMDTTAFNDERIVTLVFPRTSLTAGITANDSIYRPFDSTTYRVIKPNGDAQWNEYLLRRPFPEQ